MAASDVAIANLALTKVGDLRITSLSENTKPAREVKAVYDMLRDRLQRRYVWNFCKTRASLAALTDAPEFGFDYQYQLPSDCLRVLQAGEWFPSISLSPFVGSSSADYAIEGRRILTNDDGPLLVRYLKRVDDPTQFDSTFDVLLALDIANAVHEALAQPSGVSRQTIMEERKQALLDAIMANAIENPPEQLADDAWLLARL